MDVYSSFIHNGKNLEATKLSFSRSKWVRKLWHTQLKQCYLAVEKQTNKQTKKELSSHEKTGKKLKCKLLSLKNLSQKITSYISLTIGYSKKDKTMNRTKEE